MSTSNTPNFLLTGRTYLNSVGHKTLPDSQSCHILNPSSSSVSPVSAQMVLDIVRELWCYRDTLVGAGGCRAGGIPPFQGPPPHLIYSGVLSTEGLSPELHLTTSTELTKVPKTCGAQKDPSESKMFLQEWWEKDSLSFRGVPLFLLCSKRRKQLSAPALHPNGSGLSLP